MLYFVQIGRGQFTDYLQISETQFLLVIATMDQLGDLSETKPYTIKEVKVHSEEIGHEYMGMFINFV
jgi:hypothetical protein